ncbi:MAG: ribosome small subunit-dependent GTPase A [Lachnospiraceae bacterium]|nr:ribosome small subunit-dependent GTPase A [Lachnospiraceae bacterium]
MRGKIIRGVGGFYYVHATDGAIYECRAKGIFRKEKIKPLVGDDAEITVLDATARTGNVDLLLPRKNTLIRPAAANVDQAMIVFALTQPRPNLNLLDRFLILMSRQEIPVIICFNKADLSGEEQIKELSEIYRGCGCEVCFMSVARREGLERVRSLLDAKTTVLAGPSGVGKSSLTNAFLPEKHMEVGEVSRKIDRGKHTTRHTELLVLSPVADGVASSDESGSTYLLDTPGFSSLYLQGIAYEELKNYFYEFTPCEPYCRFQGCMHLKEPDCAVKEAVERGDIHRARYESYALLVRELRENRKY